MCVEAFFFYDKGCKINDNFKKSSFPSLSSSPDICAGVIFTRHFERLSLHLPVPRFHVKGLHRIQQLPIHFA
jgi:hypothetical protein